MDWDLATKDNWTLLLQDRRAAQLIVDPTLKPNQTRYKPINPLYANPSSNILLIGASSDTAKTYWYLGARASKYLYVSPSLNSHFISGVQVSDVKNIALGRMNLVEFKDYDVTPYVLQLDIPYWLEDIFIEVWEYTGYIDPGYQEVLDRLDAIEEKIDFTENYGI